MSSPRRLVDLSHSFTAGTVTYPGLPAPVITPHLTRAASREVYAPGTEFELDIITMIGNTGTYLDSPFHRYIDGADLSQLSLETLVDLETIVIRHDVGSGRGIGVAAVGGHDVAGRAVLLHTGWDVYFGQPEYGVDAPFLTAQAADFLAANGAALVGIDSVNIDDTQSGGARPAHTVLLGAGVHIVEHLTRLSDVPDSGAHFTAVPPKVMGFGTFPVRAFATVPS
jgi:kynurenine formamidase